MLRTTWRWLRRGLTLGMLVLLLAHMVPADPDKPRGRTAGQSRVQGQAQQPPGPRDQPLSPPARPQSRGLVSLGRGSVRQGQEGRQARLPVDRLQLLPLVPRHGARVVRERGDRQAPQPRFRLHQSRSRGTAGHRQRLHDGHAGHAAAAERRLAAVDVPHAPTASRSSAAPTGRPRTRSSRAARYAASRPSFKIVQDAWTDKPKEVRELADQNAEKTSTALEGLVRGTAILDLNRDLVDAAVDEVKESFDPKYGGFGSPARDFRGPKFPMPSRLALLQHEARRVSRRTAPRNSTTWSPSRSTTWRAAASTISSAAASIATAPNAPGPCRTSRRCCTTTPSSARSTPTPTGPRRSRNTGASWSKPSPSSAAR